MFQNKKSEVKITEKNADSILKQVKMKYKLYGEEEIDVKNQEWVPKNKILDFATVMLEMSKGQRTFGHQLFDLKFDLEKYYKIIEDKRIICVKSD